MSMVWPEVVQGGFSAGAVKTPKSTYDAAVEKHCHLRTGK